MPVPTFLNQSPNLPAESPEHFLGSSALLNLHDTKLRLRARSLTQLCKTEREKAMALHEYVKRMPFERQFKLRLRTAREVLDAGRGGASGKAALLIALLRAANIPARTSYVELRGEILRGLTSSTRPTLRPVVEMWLDGRWVRSDTFIFDVAYVVAARQRLKDRDWEWGYGIHRNGQSVWNGRDDAFLGGYSTENDPMVLQVLGVYQDPLQFVHCTTSIHKRRPLAALHSNMMALLMRKTVRKLREEGMQSASFDGPRRKSS